MTIKGISTFAIALILMVHNAAAWCAGGQVIATRIAHDILTEEAPDVLRRIDVVL